MIKRLLPALLVCALLAAAGCDTMKSSWKSTRKLYKEYVNVDPTIDLSAQAESDATVLKLARLFTPVDAQLEVFRRVFSAQESPPSREWSESLLAANPWLSGLVLLSESGTVESKLPAFSLKRVDFSPLMNFESLYKQRKMAGYVDAGDLGAEVLVAQPLYALNEFKGLLVAHFDPAALAKFSPEPDQLMILCSGVALWGGKDSATAAALAKLDWKKILASNVSGEIRHGSSTYLWQARYLAHIQLVYIVEAVPPASKSKAIPAPQPQTDPATTAPAQ